MQAAEQTGQYEPVERWGSDQWLMCQVGGLGSVIGQLGFFHKFAGKDYEDKWRRDRHTAEAGRLLAVIDKRLEGREWFVGNAYSIVDMSLLG